MAVVQMKCPNCGATMELVNNQFSCPNCRTMILNIVDAKIDTDVTVMSPDEFARKIEASKRQFVVNIDDKIKVFDVNTMVINKKIQDATHALNKGDFSAVLSILEGLPGDILSVERLRFLARYKVKNEYELSFYDGYIDNNYNYSNIIKLADDKTKATYQKLAEYCRDQYDTKKRIEAEITEVDKLLAVKLYQEAVAYTKEMCRKYPQTALSWAYACEVKCSISMNYNCDFEFSMMEKCPDYFKITLPKKLYDKISCFESVAVRYDAESDEYTKHFGIMVGCLWGSLLSLVLCAVLNLYVIPDKMKSNTLITLAMIAIYVIALVAFIIAVVGFVRAIKCEARAKKLRKEYNKIKNLVPKRLLEKYEVRYSTLKRKLFYVIFGLWCAVLVVGIKMIVKFY